MKKTFFLLLLVCFFSFCKKKDEAKWIVQPDTSLSITNKEVVMDKDSLLCEKMINYLTKSYIYSRSSTNLIIERESFRNLRSTHYSDFNFDMPDLQKGEICYMNDSSKMRTAIRISYYRYDNEQTTDEFIENYRIALDKVQENWTADALKDKSFSKGKIIGDTFLNKWTCLYKYGKTVFEITAEEDAKASIHNIVSCLAWDKDIDDRTIVYSSYTIDKLKDKKERDLLPLIDNGTIKEIEPVIKKWLLASKADIRKFRFHGYGEVPDWDYHDNMESLYHQEFDPKEDDIFQPHYYDYSPDKNRYVNLLPSRGAYLEGDTIVYMGGDDCQSIYVTDRKLQKHLMVLWHGAGAIEDACFWLDNDRFILLGESYDKTATIRIFDLKSQKSSTYSFDYDLEKAAYPEDISYFEDYNLKTRGVPILTE